MPTIDEQVYEQFVISPHAGIRALAGDNMAKRDLVLRTLKAAAQFDADDWAAVRAWLTEQESN